MKCILETWQGKYLIDKKIKTDLKDWHPKNGERFEIKLLSRKRGKKNG